MPWSASAVTIAQAAAATSLTRRLTVSTKWLSWSALSWDDPAIDPPFANRSIVTSAVVASCQPVSRIRQCKLFVKTKSRVAIHLPSLAIEVFKMQFDYSRMIEVGRKVVRGAGSYSAHAKDRILYLRRKTIDVLRIPRVVARKSPTARQSARLSAKRER